MNSSLAPRQETDKLRRSIFDLLAQLTHAESQAAGSMTVTDMTRCRAKLFYAALSSIASSELQKIDNDNKKVGTENDRGASLLKKVSAVGNDNSSRDISNYEWMPLYWAVATEPGVVTEADINVILQDPSYEHPKPSKDGPFASVLHFAATIPVPNRAVLNVFMSPIAASTKDSMKRQPLHWAAMHSGTLEHLRYFYELNPTALLEGDKDRMTPLAHIIRREKFPSKLSMVKFLAELQPDSCGSALLSLFGSVGLPDEDEYATIFDTLLEISPNAVSARDNSGKLPTHLVCEHFTAPMAYCVFRLLELYKEGVQIADDLGKLPAHYAAAHAPLPIIKAVIDAYPEASHALTEYKETVMHCVGYRSEVTDIEAIAGYIHGLNPTAITLQNHNDMRPFCNTVKEVKVPVEVMQALYGLYPEAVELAGWGDLLPLELLFHHAEYFQGSLKYVNIDKLRFLLKAHLSAAKKILQHTKWNDIHPYARRLLLRAAAPPPTSATSDLRRLRELNFNERKVAMFLALGAVPRDPSPLSFVALLRRLTTMHGKDRTLLKKIIEFI
jgi:hypothetical protein